VVAYDNITSSISDLETLFEFYESGEVDQEEIELEYNKTLDLVEKLEFKKMLSSKEDQMSAIIEINPGAGGTESQDWASILMRMYIMWAESQNFVVKKVNIQPGDTAGIKSAILGIEGEFARAVSGGVGFSKTAANYAAALYPAVMAQKDGYHQLIWTDGKEHKYVEESGTMNLFFVINNKLITPPLGDTVLDGVTRDSIILLSKHLDIDIDVRKISVEEIINSLNNNSITEAFGAGTAATIAPINTIGYKNKKYIISQESEKSISSTLLKTLNSLKYGESEDKFGWVYKLN
jgi:branched-subunit amino acid aminotransferase/4-amino-4-deoxychorismate lyase